MNGSVQLNMLIIIYDQKKIVLTVKCQVNYGFKTKHVFYDLFAYKLQHLNKQENIG